MGKFFKLHLSSLLLLFLVLIALPLIIEQAKIGQKYFTKAEYKKASFKIDYNVTDGFIEEKLTNLAQGGEVDKDGKPVSFGDLTQELALLKPKFIRIDHIFDLYTKVDNLPNGLKIDFSLLDKTLEDIIKIHAVPFLSLSYMPPSIAQNGEITGPPTDWKLWQELILKTVEHISGRDNLNLANVYYEIWNEPDLFGNWRIWGDRDYRLLYKFAFLGAQNAHNTNRFYIGGPGITHPMKNWFMDLLNFIEKEDLGIDFISWHRYSLGTEEITGEIDLVNSWVNFFEQGVKAQKIISEIGPDSENNPIYDNNLGAIYNLAMASAVSAKIDKIFNFEIIDSPSPLEKQYWGRWGLFTNGDAGLVAKPRYEALKFLSLLEGEVLGIRGEGSFVKGMATKKGNICQILLVNYQPRTNYLLEDANFTINNLPNGNYQMETKDFLTGFISAEEMKVTENTYTKIVKLSANSAVLITLTKIND